MGFVVPTTPSKKRNGLNEIIAGLNTKWRLGLPIIDQHESPSKSAHKGTHESKVANRIRALYYGSPNDLQLALEDFDRYAASINQNWVLKPYGDPDTLPGPPSAFKEGSPSRARAATLLKSLEDRLSYAHYPRPSHGLATATDQSPLQPRPTKISKTDNTNLSYNSDEDLDVTRRRGISTLWTKDASLSRSLFPRESPPQSSENFGSWREDDDQEMLNLENSEPTTPITEGTDEFHTPPEYLRSTDDDVIMVDEQTSVVSAGKMSRRSLIPRPARKRPSTGEDSSISAKRLFRDASAKNPFEIQQHNPAVFVRPQSFQSRSTSASTSFASVSTPNTSFEVKTPQTPSSLRSHTPQSLKSVRTPLLDGITIKKPSGVSVEDMKIGERVELGIEIATTARSHFILGVPAEDYLRTHLCGNMSPLAGQRAQVYKMLEFRIVYETTRVALHAGIDPVDLLSEILSEIGKRNIDTTDLGKVYYALDTCLSKRSVKLPNRPSLNAWKEAKGSYEHIMLTGDFTFGNNPDGPVLNLHLEPLKLDKSHRLSRKFGGDRFLIIGLPSLSKASLPTHLQGSSEIIGKAIVSWIVQGDHVLLGRTWKAFFIHDYSAKTKLQRGKKEDTNSTSYKIYFFATDGPGFVTESLTKSFPTSQDMRVVKDLPSLLRWFMPFSLNQDEPLLKLFSRLKLAVSKTTATLEFEDWQIVRRDDRCSGVATRPSRLDIVRSEEKKNSTSKSNNSSEVMDDGCARISLQAAKYIAEKLGLSYVPSAFQGRIASAKGMWMVDCSDEIHPKRYNSMSDTLPADKDPRVWIEISDSQLKFNSSETGRTGSRWLERARKTLEVNDYPKSLNLATLNFQLMSVLTEQGVPRNVIEGLLREDLGTRISRLKAAMNDPVALRAWNQENNPVASHRIANRGIEWLGGFPNDDSEKINCLTECGFEPRKLQYLNDLCYEKIRQYSTKLSEKMNIAVGKSTYTFMLADPVGVLSEGEIHLGFSSSFLDPISGWSDVMLAEMDVLVARLPASLPSDVQKVRAVFKVELAKYKDVIIFPVKGEKPLAAKLSGGDYDGDKAWVCWEPKIVENFYNSEPYETPSYKTYGIGKDDTKVSGMINGKGSEKEIDKFLIQAFEFALQPSLLGHVTNYHEAYVYDLHCRKRDKCLKDPKAIKIGQLLGYLVDTSKNGYTFGHKEWNEFKRNNNLKREYPNPAYKKGSSTKPNKNSIGDYLTEVAKKVIEEELGDFMKTYKDDTARWDDDLSSICKGERELVDRQMVENLGLKAVLRDLEQQTRELQNWWKQSFEPLEDEASKKAFPARAEELRFRFLQIQPCADTGSASIRWTSDLLAERHWRLLKASVLFTNHSIKDKFVWHACGIELCEIKALRTSEKLEDKGSCTGGFRVMVENIHNVFRLDTKMARRMEERNAEGITDYENTEDEELYYGEISCDDEFYTAPNETGYF